MYGLSAARCMHPHQEPFGSQENIYFPFQPDLTQSSILQNDHFVNFFICEEY